MSDSAYSAGDTVLYNGSIYVAERDVYQNTPPIESDEGWFWVVPSSTPVVTDGEFNNLKVHGEIDLSSSSSSSVKYNKINKQKIKLLNTTFSGGSGAYSNKTTEIEPGIINISRTDNLGNHTVRIDATGFACGIGTSKTTVSDEKVSSDLLEGKKVDADELTSQKVTCGELIVTDDAWADYVFKKNYNLKSLKKVEKYINKNGHLPGIPSEAEVKQNGVNMGDMQVKLLEKIEEMTLYMIELEKKVAALEEDRK